MNEQNTTNAADVEAFRDDPMELVRCVAALAVQHTAMTPEELAAQPHPFGSWSPLAQAAKRICVLRGYAEDGNELPGFMERAARADLVAPPCSTQAASTELVDMLTAMLQQLAKREAKDPCARVTVSREMLLRMRELSAAAPATGPLVAKQPELTVWYGSLPESNGKSNFTAILLRKGGSAWEGMTDGITIDQSEYPDRVRYEADRMRYLIGELDQNPNILDYDADKHSGYVAPATALVVQAEQQRVTMNGLYQRAAMRNEEYRLEVKALHARIASLEAATESAVAPADRNAVLEGAAKAAEETDVASFTHAMVLHDDGSKTRADIAAAIRALKSGSTPEGAAS